MVELLLKHHAQVDVQGKVTIESSSFLRVLSQGIDALVSRKDGWTALMQACKYGHLLVVDALLSHNARMDLLNEVIPVPYASLG